MAVLPASTLFVPYCADCDAIAHNPPALTLQECGGIIGILGAMEFFGWPVEHVMSRVPDHKRALFAAEMESYAKFCLDHADHPQAVCLRTVDGRSVVQWPAVTIGPR